MTCRLLQLRVANCLPLSRSKDGVIDIGAVVAVLWTLHPKAAKYKVAAHAIRTARDAGASIR